MAFFIVNEEFYFAKKLESLQNDEAYKAEWTGKTVVDLKAFFEANGLTAQQHFDEFGWAEQLSANAEFDVAAYFAAKAKQTGLPVEEVIQAFKDNGLTVATHYEKYGKAEIEAGELDFTPGATAPSTLTEALAALKAAQTAKEDFLKANKKTGDADTAATEARIEGAVAKIDTEDAGNANDLYTLAAFGPSDTEGVKQAKIADKTASLAATIKTEETDLAAAKAAVAAKAGLSAAMDTLNTREAALKNGQKTADAAQATLEGAIIEAASLATKAAGATPAPADKAILDKIKVLTTTSANTGEITDVITKVDGKLTISKDVKDATVKAALEKVLTALNADIAADDMVETLTTARDDAAATVKFIDAATGTKNDLKTALDAVYGTGKPLGGTAPTNADAITHTQVKNALTALYDLASTFIAEGATKGLEDLQAALELGASAAADFGVTDPDDAAAFDAALAAYAGVNTELDDFVGLAASSFPASTAQATAQTDLETAQKAAADFAELVEARKAASELAAELKALEDKETAAQEAFKTLGYEAPETLVGTTVVASGEDDLYLAGTKDTTIVGFSSEGSDALYIGTSFTYNAGDVAKDGVDSVLEVFFVQEGNNTKIVLETKTYGSNEDNVAETTITLTGVKATDLTLTEDGFVTLA